MSRIQSILELSLVKNTLKLSSSSALMMFLPLIVTPILSRLYTPEDYGDWGVFSSTIYIVNSFLFLSYDNALVKTTIRKEIPYILALCIGIVCIVLFFIVLLFNLGQILCINYFVNFPSLPLLILLIGITALNTLIGNVANYEKKYNTMAIAGIICGISQAGFRIFFGVFPLLPYGLIVGNILGTFAGFLFLLISLHTVFLNFEYRSINKEKIIEVSKTYKKFPIYDAPSRFFEFAVGNLALIILALFWSKDEIGCFSMVTQFILIPIAIIGSAMGNVFYKQISEEVTDIIAFNITTTRAAKITFSLSCLPALFLAFGGDYLFIKFLGEKWSNVGPMSLCMSVFSIPVILSEPLLAVFKTLDKQEIRFRLNLVNFFASLGLLFVVSYYVRDIYVSLLVYSFSYAIIRFFLFYYEMQLAEVKITAVSRHFFLVIIISYIVLLSRIVIILF